MESVRYPARQADASERGKEGGRGKKKPSGQIAHKVSRAADKAAKATGKKRSTLRKAEEIVAAADRDPERFSDGTASAMMCWGRRRTYERSSGQT